MNGHERLEFEMAIDQVKEILPKIAELAYEYFSQLLKSGFDEKQALFSPTYCAVKNNACSMKNKHYF